MRHRWFLPLVLLMCAAILSPDLGAGTRLLRHPDLHGNKVVFSYGNDIWLTSDRGGEAERLTTYQGQETQPRFSPNGDWIAFSGQYDGNTDVYLIPTAGGQPKRLTWHPGVDTVMGWTADGKNVIFRSGRTGAPTGIAKFWKIAVTGGEAKPLAIPRVWEGSYSADEKWFAYRPINQFDAEWRNYRGGQIGPIWLVDTKRYNLTKLPWKDSNDLDPVWVGDTIYFLSDRDYAMNVYRFKPGSSSVEQVTRFKEFDCKNLESDGNRVIFENGGYLHILAPNDSSPKQLEIQVSGDLPWVRPHWEDVGGQAQNARLSPTGKRVVFEARGEIFTAPVKDGNWRNLTRSSAVADRNPIWSPDGSKIAWFSDEGGEYGLVISDQEGESKRRIDLPAPTFYFTPAWSPDSKKILFTDEGLNLSYLDVETGKQTQVDYDTYAHPQRTMDPVWSPDSNWIAYAKRLDNQYHAIKVFSLEENKIHQLTDGLSDAVSPAWDEGGKYLYFLSSTNFALGTGWLDMSSYERDTRRELYFAVLQKTEPSPLLPKSDEEEVKAEEDESDKKNKKDKDAEKKDEEEDTSIVIDWDGISQRILSINAPSRTYAGLFAGEEGTVFYAETIPNKTGFTLHRWSMEDRESKKFLSGAFAASLSHDKKKLLYQNAGGMYVVGSGAPVKGGDGKVSLNGVRAKIDPRAEWRQMFREAWRYQRDFFYVENVHGADWDWTYDAYLPWVDHVAHRSDLTHLLDILGGETAVGHSFTGGGDLPDVARVNIGQLGADISSHKGRYRIDHILTGENWNPNLRAPLSAPGIDVKEGDYILEVDGVELTSDMNLYEPFEGTAGRQVRLKINDKPTAEGAREVTVVPIPNEVALRQRNWVEDNRRKVDELSGGRLAYVWLPNTGGGGYTEFNRYYFAQQHKEGAVIDERFNGGGSAADYMVDVMNRELQGFFNNPVGDKKPFTNPGAGIWGPKVMIINESAGSGGDLLPWMFRNMEIGPLVGTTTWGGLVGIWDVPPLIDGGFITAPRGGFYNNEGEWAVENEGVEPDIEVHQTPKEVIAGGDPQLERAVKEAMRLLKSYDGQKVLPQPADPIRSRRPD